MWMFDSGPVMASWLPGNIKNPLVFGPLPVGVGAYLGWDGTTAVLEYALDMQVKAMLADPSRALAGAPRRVV